MEYRHRKIPPSVLRILADMILEGSGDTGKKTNILLVLPDASALYVRPGGVHEATIQHMYELTN